MVLAKAKWTVSAPGDVLAEIVRLAPGMRWKKHDWAAASEYRCFSGDGDGWIVTVCDFDIEEQGFAPGTRGYDGAAAMVEGLVIRLGHEVGETVWQIARRNVK